MKQTKPAQAMELRSLSPVFGGPNVARCLVRAQQTRLQIEGKADGPVAQHT
jgi:hypothetical protein